MLRILKRLLENRFPHLSCIVQAVKAQYIYRNRRLKVEVGTFEKTRLLEQKKFRYQILGYAADLSRGFDQIDRSAVGYICWYFLTYGLGIHCSQICRDLGLCP